MCKKISRSEQYKIYYKYNNNNNNNTRRTEICDICMRFPVLHMRSVHIIFLRTNSHVRQVSGNHVTGVVVVVVVVWYQTV